MRKNAHLDTDGRPVRNGADALDLHPTIAVAVVFVEEVVPGLAGHIEVQEAVVVVVRPGTTGECVSIVCRVAGQDPPKSAVALIVVEEIYHVRGDIWRAVVRSEEHTS